MIYSATKYIDGQGRVLGGAVVGSKELVVGKMYPADAHHRPDFERVQRLGVTQRTGDAAPAYRSAMRQRPATRTLARNATANHARFHPSLDSHPQRELAARQQRHGGAIVLRSWANARPLGSVVDRTQMLSITANLGDVKSTITHPASTTHGRITPEARARAGITEGLLRVSVGLENIEDIQADLARGLAALAHSAQPAVSLRGA